MRAAHDQNPAVIAAVAAASIEVKSRQDLLLAAPATLDTYEQLEKLLQIGDGVDLSPARARLDELAAEPAIRDELTARTAWSEGRLLMLSLKSRDRDRGHTILSALARSWPATKYGRAAAQRLEFPP